MRKLEYTVRFATPAFLGNAEKEGQWRTPPFKALLRQWWRVAAAKSFDYDHRRMREAEGQLFGHAWLKGDRDRQGKPVSARRSEVLIRLNSWAPGDIGTADWPGGPMDQVITTKDGKGKVRSDVYLGFGPVLPPSKKQGRSRVEIRNAIGTGQGATLRFGLPEDDTKEQRLRNVMTLLQWFGTLGSRSRNGWGSLDLVGGSAGRHGLPDLHSDALIQVLRPWEKCLASDNSGGCDWPHAIGNDDRGAPLVWHTEPLADWRKAMGRLANVRVEARRVAKAFRGPDRIGGVHLLGYPAGGDWELRGIDSNLRLGTQLRFKVLALRDGQVRGLVYHLPCRVPEPFLRQIGERRSQWLLSYQASVWKAVHQALDSVVKLQRLGGD